MKFPHLTEEFPQLTAEIPPFDGRISAGTYPSYTTGVGWVGQVVVAKVIEQFDKDNRRAETHAKYSNMLARLSRALLKGDHRAKRQRSHLLIQQTFVDKIVQIMQAVAKESGSREKKAEFLKNQIAASSEGTTNSFALKGLLGGMTLDSLLYVYSCDLNHNVQVKIGSLDGKFDKPDYKSVMEDPSLESCVALQAHDDSTARQHIYVTCQVYCNQSSVGVPMQTQYKSFTKRWSWNEWLTLPVKYKELSRDALLALTLYDLHDSTTPHVIGSTTIALFSKRAVFRQGIYDLKVWPFVLPDSTQPSTTPGKVCPPQQKDADLVLDGDDDESEMRRLGKLSKKHRSGQMDKVDWLDRMTFREIEHVNERHKRHADSLFIVIHFPRVHFNNQEYVIMYYEKGMPDLYNYPAFPKYVRVPDSDIGQPNIVEHKYNEITRSVENDATARQLKPNAAQREKLNSILKDLVDYLFQLAPSVQLSSEQTDLVWKFRYYLSSDKKALSKFVKSVKWDVQKQADHAKQLLKEWSPMDVEDALELLSERYCHADVRRYAVSRLKTASPEYLQLFLLQLVQALKYEKSLIDLTKVNDPSYIKEFTSSSVLELPPSSPIPPALADSTTSIAVGEEAVPAEVVRRDSQGSSCCESEDLATFLIECACKDSTMANYLYWYVKVEMDCLQSQLQLEQFDKDNRRAETHAKYSNMLARLSRALLKGDHRAKRQRSHLLIQQTFVDKIVQIMQAVAKESGSREKKAEFLKNQIAASSEGTTNFFALKGLPLPLNPCCRLESIILEHVSLFSSSRMPCKLDFKLQGSDTPYTTIFKNGDDLRQDQLILQIIELLDKLLRSENLDLRLQPYKVLATGVDSGFVEFINKSIPLRDVVKEFGSVKEFLEFYRPAGKGQIEPVCMDNFVKSCAGYSVICYLLGIGDRHQHNLMLCQNGKLFHIDFGYILGRDPKPMPPPMKITREMVDAMGGLQSPHWHEFRRLCYLVFQTLRRHANVILNLFSLMVDSGIPDIAMEPDKAVRKVEERFHLELSDEQVVVLVQNLIDRSVNAKMAVIADYIHNMMVT